MAETQHDSLAHTTKKSGSDPRQTLIEQLKADDPAAWELLYELYSPVICDWAKEKGVRCPHERENVVQDVFTKVVKNINSYQELENRGSFPGWLYTITRNHIYSKGSGDLATVGGSNWQQRMYEIPFPKNPTSQRFDSVWERRQKQSDQKSKFVSTIFAWIEQRSKSKNRNKSVLKGLLMDNKPAKEIADDHNVTTNVIYQIKSRMVSQIRKRFGDSAEQAENSGG